MWAANRKCFGVRNAVECRCEWGKKEFLSSSALHQQQRRIGDGQSEFGQRRRSLRRKIKKRDLRTEDWHAYRT